MTAKVDRPRTDVPEVRPRTDVPEVVDVPEDGGRDFPEGDEADDALAPSPVGGSDQ